MENSWNSISRNFLSELFVYTVCLFFAVVFIAAPCLQTMQDFDGSLEKLARESDALKQAYGHFFDLTIVNNDIDETIRILERALEKINLTPQWVPISW